MSRVASLLTRLIRGYQHVRAGRPSPCRFQPSCSSYALEALEVHGALRGTRFALGRLTRCRPWGGHGWDPVPLPEVPTPGAHHHSHDERTVA